ncbi:MAG: glycoside hydrolase family 43 protein [Candidatus Limnocylindrales bacterium]
MIETNFPDPDVLQVEGTFYAYATTNAGPGVPNSRNFQAARSTDLIEWEVLEDAMPELPSWSGLTPLFGIDPHEATWAPDVSLIGDRFVMHYTAPALDMERPDGRPAQCIGVAEADSPEGPFVDTREEPLVCQADLGGSIDGAYFRDEDGTQYLVWKNDGNCCARPTNFFLQELSEDGMELEGEVTQLEGLEDDNAWEAGVIEAPTIVVHDETYYMFYSGNGFATHAYAVGYATAEEVIGPYTDAEENPILATDLETARDLGLAGPGHQTVFEDHDGDLWMAYHAWPSVAIGTADPGRQLWLDELVFEDGKPVVKGPDRGPQPAP